MKLEGKIFRGYLRGFLETVGQSEWLPDSEEGFRFLEDGAQGEPERPLNDDADDDSFRRRRNSSEKKLVRSDGAKNLERIFVNEGETSILEVPSEQHKFRFINPITDIL